MKIKETKMVKEALVIDAYNIVKDLLPATLFAGSRDSKTKEKAKVVVEDLIDTLNRFYAEHDINWKVKTMKRVYEMNKKK